MEPQICRKFQGPTSGHIETLFLDIDQFGFRSVAHGTAEDARVSWTCIGPSANPPRAVFMEGLLLVLDHWPVLSDKTFMCCVLDLDLYYFGKPFATEKIRSNPHGKKKESFIQEIEHPGIYQLYAHNIC